VQIGHTLGCKSQAELGDRTGLDRATELHGPRMVWLRSMRGIIS
jgi:hypothetical protein